MGKEHVMARPFPKLLTSQKNADKIIEHDCMSCMESWDVLKTEGEMELCKYCGSKDIRTRPGVPHRVYIPYDDDRYTGPDIFDQYGRY